MMKQILTKKEFINLLKKGLSYDSLEKDLEGRYIVTILDEKDTQIKKLREEREKECFLVINRGILWYRTLNEWQLTELKKWYEDWLNCTVTLTKPEKPSWL